MAITAIRMHLRKLARLALVAGRFGFLMLMRVMAEMLDRRRLFMLAIDSRHRPGKLERQCQQHQDDQQFFHGANLNTEISFVISRLHAAFT